MQQQESQESRDADSPVLGLTQRAFSDNNVHTYPWYLRSLVVVVAVVVFFSADSSDDSGPKLYIFSRMARHTWLICYKK